MRHSGFVATDQGILLCETLAGALSAALGLVLGLLTARSRRPWWLAAWGVSLGAILGLAATHRWSQLSFVVPFSLLAHGTRQFIVFSGAASLLLASLAPRLSRRRERNLVFLFLGVVVSVAGLAPLGLPLILRNRHLALGTELDQDGVCRQPDGYTCGPAAAVTALGWLGVPEKLGELAIDARTTPLTGTPVDLLLEALRVRHASKGLQLELCRFDSIGELVGPGIVSIVVVRHSFLIDHYVAVRSLTDSCASLGDPLAGLRDVSFAELQRLSRGIAIRVRAPR